MFATMTFRWFPIAILAVVLTACGNDNSTENVSDPVLNEPAVKKITEEIKSDPDNARLYFERGIMLDGMDADTLALADYKKAISLDSTRSEYYSAIGDMFFEHKDIEGSTKWLEKALALNPKDKRAHLKLAKMFLYIEEYNKAFAEINTVLRQDVYNAEGYYLKGMVYKNLKDTAMAISSFHTAIQSDPEYREAIIQLGIMYGMKGDPIALQFYDRAFKMDTLNVFPLYARGVFFQDKGSYEQAKDEYRNTIMHDRYYANAYYNMGYIYLQQDSLEKALRQYDILTNINLQDPEAYFNRGLCYENMGRKAEAIADYKQALVFDENYKDALEGLKRLGAQP